MGNGFSIALWQVHPNLPRAEDVGLTDKQVPCRLSPVSEANTPLCSLQAYHGTPAQPMRGLAPLIEDPNTPR